MSTSALIALLDRYISEVSDLRRQQIDEFVSAHGGTLEAFQIEDAMDDAEISEIQGVLDALTRLRESIAAEKS